MFKKNRLFIIINIILLSFKIFLIDYNSLQEIVTNAVQNISVGVWAILALMYFII